MQLLHVADISTKQLSRSTRPATVYVCVYRQFLPRHADVELTRSGAIGDSSLLNFIESHARGETFFDWGDDPSFFSSLRAFGNAEHATWGVCRPNVRASLRPEDVVVFFCAKRKPIKVIDYHFIGVSTAGQIIDNRAAIWSEQEYRPYRSYLNILASYSDGRPLQHEMFHPVHKDWERRLASPYVIFAPDQSRFNLQSPLLVATSVDGKREVWHSARDPRVARIESLLFTQFDVTRRLRTSSTGFAHPHVNLSRALSVKGIAARTLRDALLPLVAT